MYRYFISGFISGHTTYVSTRLYTIYESGYWYQYNVTKNDQEYMEYPAILKEFGNYLVTQTKYREALGYYRQASEIDPNIKEGKKTIDQFMKESNIKKFFLQEIDKLLDNYYLL